jgi:transcriptional regulator with XRE-family HTH domain
MKENDINQKQLASLLHITQSHLSKVLNGRKKAGAQLVEKYYNLPGVQEKEKLDRVREVINNLWTDGVIDNNTAKIILKQINPGD